MSRAQAVAASPPPGTSISAEGDEERHDREWKAGERWERTDWRGSDAA